MATKKTYAINTFCKNCRYTDEFNIPVGTQVNQVLPNVKCLKCGCVTVRQKDITRTTKE